MCSVTAREVFEVRAGQGKMSERSTANAAGQGSRNQHKGDTSIALQKTAVGSDRYSGGVGNWRRCGTISKNEASIWNREGTCSDCRWWFSKFDDDDKSVASGLSWGDAPH